MPVTLHGAVHLGETPKISGDAVVGMMAAQEGVNFAHLVTDHAMSYLPHKLLQRRKAAPQTRFLGAHPNLEVISGFACNLRPKKWMVSGRFLLRLPACRCANRPNLTNLVVVDSRVRPNFPNRRPKAS